MKIGLLLAKNVFTPLIKSALKPLGLTSAFSVVNIDRQKKPQVQKLKQNII